MGVESLTHGITKCYITLGFFCEFPDFCKEFERNSAITFSHYIFVSRVVSIGYSIVFKKTAVNVYHGSRLSTLVVHKCSTICLVLLNRWWIWSLVLPSIETKISNLAFTWFGSKRNIGYLEPSGILTVISPGNWLMDRYT